MRRFPFLYLSLFALLLCYCGCSGSPANVSKVEGTVTFDAEPLSGASVTFYPESGARPSAGETDENGKYSLRYTLSLIHISEPTRPY